MMIKDKYRKRCILILGKSGACFTYVVRNRICDKKTDVKTSHILQNLKQLEKDGYVSSDKSGSGYFWILTSKGREFYNALTA